MTIDGVPNVIFCFLQKNYKGADIEEVKFLVVA